MSDELEIGIDEFAIELNRIFDNLGSGVSEYVGEAVDMAAKAGRKVARKNAPVRNDSHPKKGSYRRSLNYVVTVSGSDITAEIGSRSQPGLVHLLEKGHATLGGGFVAPRQHMLQAKQEADKILVSEIGSAVDRAMEEA